MAFQYGLKIDLVGKGNSPPGGWPQYKMIVGHEETLKVAVEKFHQCFMPIFMFFQNENVRMHDELGRIMYPGINAFVEPKP